MTSWTAAFVALLALSRPLLVIAVTGMCISIDGVKQFVLRTFGTTRPVAEAPPPSPNFDLDTAWSEAAKRVPHWPTINGRWPARDGKFNLRIRTAEALGPTSGTSSRTMRTLRRRRET